MECIIYNVNGVDEFKYDDLFLLGLDSLHVDEVGSMQAKVIENSFSASDLYLEYVLGGIAIVVGILAVLV